MSENPNPPADSLGFPQPLKFDINGSTSNAYRRKLSEEICEKLLQAKQVSDPQLPDRYEMLIKALANMEKPQEP